MAEQEIADQAKAERLYEQRNELPPGSFLPQADSDWLIDYESTQAERNLKLGGISDIMKKLGTTLGESIEERSNTLMRDFTNRFDPTKLTPTEQADFTAILQNVHNLPPYLKIIQTKAALHGIKSVSRNEFLYLLKRCTYSLSYLGVSALTKSLSSFGSFLQNPTLGAGLIGSGLVCAAGMAQLYINSVMYNVIFASATDFMSGCNNSTMGGKYNKKKKGKKSRKAHKKNKRRHTKKH